MTIVGDVVLWGTRIGAVACGPEETIAAFEFDPGFVGSGIEVSPLEMPLSPRVYRFPMLAPTSFYGLPGLLADSLPDKYGNALIDAWLARQGRLPGSFTPIERLSYVGTRGMGALEFRPATGPDPGQGDALDVAALVALASDVLTHRGGLQASLAETERAAAMQDILRVGTSAGGARAKAVVAFNPRTNEIRSGQVDAGAGFSHWLIKFDGVAANQDKELADPQGYGAVEYAYALMAQSAGIEMSACRLLEEGGRRHFMTRRFDRTEDGDKLHMQSLAAIAHFDFNDPRAYSYEQAFLVMRRLGLSLAAAEQQFRRMVFNVIARNQDDHVKNIAFLMDRAGVWRLSPAFDVTWSYNPAGQWTARHQMSIAGKREDFGMEDLLACARSANLKPARAKAVIAQVRAVVAGWAGFAKTAGVRPKWIEDVQATLRIGSVFF